MSRDDQGPAYFHGADPAEQRRLEAQATLLGGADFLPQLRPGMHVLDVGCGTGAIARAVARAVAPGLVTGVDRSEAQIAAAARLASDEGLENIRFAQGDAHELAWPDGSFDAAYSRFLLEHVAQPQQVVGELRRVVRPGGWACAYEWEAGCIVNYPDSPAVDRVWRSVYQWQGGQGGDPWVGRKLYGLFARAGFAEIRAEGRGWTITGAAREAERLGWYVSGAREIIRQASDGMLAARLVTPETLAEADREYDRLLASPETFIFHGFCRVTGVKP